MKTVKVFGIWNLVLLLVTAILFIASIIQKDYLFAIPLGFIGISELLMGFTGLVVTR
ncbi:MAG: hypothetical protein ABH811_02355 [archaeon]